MVSKVTQESNGRVEQVSPVSRARLVRAQVQLDVVIDDGGALVPVPVQPFTVTEKEWPPDLDQVLAQIQEEFARSNG